MVADRVCAVRIIFVDDWMSEETMPIRACNSWWTTYRQPLVLAPPPRPPVGAGPSRLALLAVTET